MQAAVLEVQEAYSQLATFTENHSSDRVYSTLLSYDLLSLGDRISLAIMSMDKVQLAQCLKDCHRLAARTQAVRRLSPSLHHLGNDSAAYAPSYGD